jgi:hypothetical protein
LGVVDEGGLRIRRGWRPGRLGCIVGFGAGTGSALALLPAQNATGNCNRIVQCVPVRIALERPLPEGLALRVGLAPHATARLGTILLPTLLQGVAKAYVFFPLQTIEPLRAAGHGREQALALIDRDDRQAFALAATERFWLASAQFVARFVLVRAATRPRGAIGSAGDAH